MPGGTLFNKSDVHDVHEHKKCTSWHDILILIREYAACICQDDAERLKIKITIILLFLVLLLIQYI